jgi:non-ribosomal peptide synthetase component F
LRELIARVRGTDLAAYGHQDLPFERLVEVLNPPRSLARHPLFQVLLAFQNTTAFDFSGMPGLQGRFEPLGSRGARFDLSFSLAEERAADGTPLGIAGVLDYGGCRSRPSDRGARYPFRARAPHDPDGVERHCAPACTCDTAGAVRGAGREGA